MKKLLDTVTLAFRARATSRRSMLELRTVLYYKDLEAQSQDFHHVAVGLQHELVGKAPFNQNLISTKIIQGFAYIRSYLVLSGWKPLRLKSTLNRFWFDTSGSARYISFNMTHENWPCKSSVHYQRSRPLETVRFLISSNDLMINGSNGSMNDQHFGCPNKRFSLLLLAFLI